MIGQSKPNIQSKSLKYKWKLFAFKNQKEAPTQTVIRLITICNRERFAFKWTHSQPTEDNVTMYVCLCKAVTDSQIIDAVDEGAFHVSHLAEAWGLGTGCGRCCETAQRLIDERLAEALTYAAA